MRDEEVDLNLMRALLDEVLDVLRAPAFLGSKSGPTEKFIRFGDRRAYKWIAVDCRYYIDSIDINNKDSSHVELNGIIDSISKSSVLFSSYAPIEEVEQLRRSIFESASAMASKATSVQELAVAASLKSDGRHSSELIRAHILNMVSTHFRAIVDARVITLSRRFPITEVLLDAYSCGAFPFGFTFEDNNVLCLRSDGAGWPA